MNSMLKIKPFVIGVLSDTHGPVPNAALDALNGVDHILHAGDVEAMDVIDTLSAIAPVTAVRGNMDRRGNKKLDQSTQYVLLCGVGIYLLHDLFQLDIEPEKAGVDIVVHGHTHQAKIEWRGNTLYLNPGSAAKPRGGRPASVARITIDFGNITPEIVRLPA